MWLKFTEVPQVPAVSFIALKMDGASIPETSVKFYHTTRRNNPVDNGLHTRQSELEISPE
jgi:hypothetical protein